MRTQDEFLLDLLRRLAACGVDYMLTGSMASNYWGIPRTTHDVDFVVVFGADKVAGLLDAFSTDMFIQENSVRAAFRPPHQFNVIDNQSALKADFWLLRDVPFDPGDVCATLEGDDSRYAGCDRNTRGRDRPQTLLGLPDALCPATRGRGWCLRRAGVTTGFGPHRTLDRTFRASRDLGEDSLGRNRA
jgi:hypothetical protein